MSVPKKQTIWGKAKKKPVEIQFREVEPKTLIRIKMPEGKKVWGEIIETLEGNHEAHVGKDFIIKGVRGELYPIKKDIFYQTYDVIITTDGTVLKGYHDVEEFYRDE